MAGAPLVVCVHGIARDPAAHARRLIDYAERYGLSVVAPKFDKVHFGLYQQLADPKTGVRSDIALLDIIDAASRLTNADETKILLVGQSGGAQFAHRFAMVHPRRVISNILIAAGWYTFPIEYEPYPFGLDTRATGVDFCFDMEGLATVRQHVFVGELDTERDNSLRRSKAIDRVQGRTRLERAIRWVSAMGKRAERTRENAPPTLSTLPGVGHSFSDPFWATQLPALVFERFAADAGLQPMAKS